MDLPEMIKIALGCSIFVGIVGSYLLAANLQKERMKANLEREGLSKDRLKRLEEMRWMPLHNSVPRSVVTQPQTMAVNNKITGLGLHVAF
jgi:hypothetical protein